MRSDMLNRAGTVKKSDGTADVRKSPSGPVGPAVRQKGEEGYAR